MILQNINTCQIELAPLPQSDILELIAASHDLDPEEGIPEELGAFVCEKV